MHAKPPTAPTRSLRIAMMLGSDGPGGAEMMVLRLSNELRKRGHFIQPVGPAHGVGWLGEHLRRAGFSPEVFHLKRAVDPRGVRDLMRLFRKHRIDAVHSHEFTMAVYGAAASRILGLPHVVTMHGGLTVCKVLRRRVALRWAMRSSDHTVMVSRATRHQFAHDLGIDESRLAVIPNGVPVQHGDAVRVRKEFGVGEHDCVLLAVGTLETHKGHRVLLDALMRLDRIGARAPWKLIIAGGRGGDQHQALLNHLDEAGFGDRVRIVLNRDDIPDLLALADVFVMPSLWEGLPMALLEAMLAGKAIIASATAGIPEAITDGRDGILVAPDDVIALADALRQVVANPQRRADLGAAALLRAEKDFTVHVMAERYEQLYFHAPRPHAEIEEYASRSALEREGERPLQSARILSRAGRPVKPAESAGGR
jgi:glycosyltransferase involved in cell wall biosynthesis